MFSLKIENSNGEMFELTHDTKNYYITDVEGLTPPPTVVNTATAGIIDGTFFNSARVEQRNIVITVVLAGDIEANRQRLYKIFPRKTPCTVYFKNKNRNVKIEGYVEMLEGSLFSQQETMQISIICPRPYFEALTTLYNELSRILALFQFPFSIITPIPFSEILDNPLCIINNIGDAACGTLIEVDFSGEISELKIFHTTTQKFFEVKYNFIDNDRLIINTRSGEMSIYLYRSGIKTNLLNYVSKNSSWLRIEPGRNTFTFTVGDDESVDNVNIHFTTALLYGGV